MQPVTTELYITDTAEFVQDRKRALSWRSPVLLDDTNGMIQELPRGSPSTPTISHFSAHATFDSSTPACVACRRTTNDTCEGRDEESEEWKGKEGKGHTSREPDIYFPGATESPTKRGQSMGCKRREREGEEGRAGEQERGPASITSDSVVRPVCTQRAPALLQHANS